MAYALSSCHTSMIGTLAVAGILNKLIRYLHDMMKLVGTKTLWCMWDVGSQSQLSEITSTKCPFLTSPRLWEFPFCISALKVLNW